MMVLVGDVKAAGVDGVDERGATGVIKRRPACVVGVEVAQQDGVAVRVVEDLVKVWRVVGRAGRGRRNVDGVDIEGGVVEVDFSRDDFDNVVVGGDGGGIDGGEFQVMVDEESDTAPAASRSVLLPDGEVAERDFGGRPKLGLLDARDLDILIVEEAFNFILGGVEAVGVELEDLGRDLRLRRTRAMRTGIAVDVIGEEEEEEKETGERFDGLFMPARGRRRRAGRERRRGEKGDLGLQFGRRLILKSGHTPTTRSGERAACTRRLTCRKERRHEILQRKRVGLGLEG